MRDLEGLQYCIFLDKHRVKPKWSEDGPKSYRESYLAHGSYRKKVQDEKSRAKQRMRKHPDSMLMEAFVTYLRKQFKRNGVVTISVLIFHRDGEPMPEFRKSWTTACRLAGVCRLFHDLRRSACRNMVAAGVAQVTAMQLSGHKTDSMFRRYAIVAENDMRAALRITQNHLATVRKNLVSTQTVN